MCHLQKALSEGPGAENGGSPSGQANTHPSFHILWSGLFWALLRERRTQRTQAVWSHIHLPSHKSNSSRSGQLLGDGLVNGLRRFRRGPVRQMCSDNESNFIGVRRELKEGLAEMDQDQVKAEMLKKNCERSFNQHHGWNLGALNSNREKRALSSTGKKRPANER